jgi:hypothetical protein
MCFKSQVKQASDPKLRGKSDTILTRIDDNIINGTALVAFRKILTPLKFDGVEGYKGNSHHSPALCKKFEHKL